jgi:hypothetical protein
MELSEPVFGLGCNRGEQQISALAEGKMKQPLPGAMGGRESSRDTRAHGSLILMAEWRAEVKVLA